MVPLKKPSEQDAVVRLDPGDVDLKRYLACNVPEYRRTLSQLCDKIPEQAPPSVLAVLHTTTKAPLQQEAETKVKA